MAGIRIFKCCSNLDDGDNESAKNIIISKINFYLFFSKKLNIS
jgi:hypothetical protein